MNQAQILEAVLSDDKLSIPVYLEEVKKQEARESLLDFILYTKKDYEVNWHHQLICEELDGFLADPNRNRLMVFVQPRSGKSEIISRRLPAYYLGKNPKGQVIATSYGAELAQAMNRDVQRVIDDPKYTELFPETRLNSVNVRTTAKKNYIRTTDKFEIVEHGGIYKCAGICGALTGFGATLAIIDDPIKDMQEAMSPKRKEMVHEWYQAVLSTRLVGEEKVIIILTRWAEDDLAGRLLKEAEVNPDADQWEIISLPTAFTADNPYIHPSDPRIEEGEILWKSRMTPEKAKSVKASVGSKVWESLYQQNPTPSGGIIFQPHWIQHYKDLPTLEYKIASWDFTFKDSSASDYVAGGVWGIAGPNRYLLYLIRERLNFVDSIKAMLRVNHLFPDLRFNVIEDKANGPAIISTLKDKIPSLLAYCPKEGKEARANAVAPQFEAGNIWVPDMYYGPNRTAHPWMMQYLEIFLNEFKTFPFGPHDDMVDMTTQALLKLGSTPNWLNQLVSEAMNEKPSQQDAYTNKIADLMNWDLG